MIDAERYLARHTTPPAHDARRGAPLLAHPGHEPRPSAPTRRGLERIRRASSRRRSSRGPTRSFLLDEWRSRVAGAIGAKGHGCFRSPSHRRPRPLRRSLRGRDARSGSRRAHRRRRIHLCVRPHSWRSGVTSSRPTWDARRRCSTQRASLASSTLRHGSPATVWLKREDLCHTGAHKINNALGQVLLAKKMGKSRVIAETGAGQHGVATATACALFGIPCEVFMGAEDVRRQAPNVGRMKLLGARVVDVTSGSRIADADERGDARLGDQR